MAFASLTAWEVRSTGSDSNGGGFNRGSTGTDRSQSNGAYIAFTDLVIDATTNTKITSIANPFDATSPGNIINVTGGVGFTVQRLQISSVAGSVATCDKAVGTVGSTGGIGNLGGGLLTLGVAAALVVADNRIYIQAGTYTLTTVATLAAGCQVIGYQTTHDDFGTRPLITTSTNNTRIFLANGAGRYFFANLQLTNTASVRATGIESARGDIPATLYRCLLDGFSIGIKGDTGTGWNPTLRIIETEIKNCTSHGFTSTFPVFILYSYIHNNVGSGGSVTFNSSAVSLLLRSIFAANTVDGFTQASANVTSNQYMVYECTFANNGRDGLRLGNSTGPTAPLSIELVNNLFYGNTGYGVYCPATPFMLWMNRSNAYGSNGTDVLNLSAGIGDVTLTADPFTNSASGDYSLNSAANGGALCKGAGYQVS